MICNKKSRKLINYSFLFAVLSQIFISDFA